MKPNRQTIGITEFIDKLTARWLFEKTGVELYDHAIRKCPNNGPSGIKEKLEEIREQENDHAELLEDVIRHYGADPHKLTKWARVTQEESEGIVKVIEKEEFDIVIDALLAAELVDTASWEFLILLAEKVGAGQFKPAFEQALLHETEHLRFIRGILVGEITGKAA